MSKPKSVPPTKTITPEQLARSLLRRTRPYKKRKPSKK